MTLHNDLWAQLGRLRARSAVDRGVYGATNVFHLGDLANACGPPVATYRATPHGANTVDGHHPNFVASRTRAGMGDLSVQLLQKSSLSAEVRSSIPSN